MDKRNSEEEDRWVDKRAKASEEPDMLAVLQLQIDRMKAEKERHKAELAEKDREIERHKAELAERVRKRERLADELDKLRLQLSHLDTSSSTSPGTVAISSIRAAFSQTFVDPNGIVKSLIRHIDSVAKDWPCTQDWIAPLVVLVQGSGMGKSRSMREVANSRFSVYVCLRGASEVAYPHRSFITDTFLRTPPENFTYFCVQFIAGCMFHLQEAIQESITEWMQSDGKSNLLTPESFIKPQLIGEGGQTFWKTILATIAILEEYQAFSNLQKVSSTGSFPTGITPRTDQPKPGESGDAPLATDPTRRQHITAYFHSRADKLKDAIQSLSICQIRTALDREQFDMDKLRSILDQHPYERLIPVLETLCSSSFDSVSELGNITALCDALKNNDMEQSTDAPTSPSKEQSTDALKNNDMEQLADVLKNNNMEQLAVALESFASACQAAMIFSFDEVASLLADCGCTEPSVCNHNTGRLNQLREVLGCLPKTTSHAIVSVWADTSMSIAKIAPIKLLRASTLRAGVATKIPTPFSGVFYWDVISVQDRFCMAHHVIDDWVGRRLSLRVETLQMSSDLQMKIWTSLLLLGRPLWSTVELGPPVYGFPILINTALLKMCHSTRDPFSLLDGTGAAGSRHAYLAMANARLCLKTVGSFELTSTMTAKYMAVCTSISPSRDAMEISYLSDPIFAEAGASAMNEFRWLMLVRHLCTAVQNGSMSGGDRGELVARILLLMAMDSSRSSPGVCKRTMPVTVKAFLGHLFGPKAVSAMLDGFRAHLEGDGVRTTARTSIAATSKALHDTLLNGIVFFNHFASTADGNFDGILEQAFSRCAAIFCRANQAVVDLIIPVYLTGAKRFTAILIQVKNQQKPCTPSDAAGITPTEAKLNISKSGEEDLPYLNIFMSFGQKPKLEVCKNPREPMQLPIFAGGLQDVYHYLLGHRELKEALKLMLGDPKYRTQQLMLRQGSLHAGKVFGPAAPTTTADTDPESS